VSEVTITEHENGDLTVTCFDGVPPWHELDVVEAAAVEAHYRAKFVAERMPEDVQKLVEEVKRLVREGDRRLGYQLAAEGNQAWADQMLDAIQRLEAAYSQKVEPAHDEGWEKSAEYGIEFDAGYTNVSDEEADPAEFIQFMAADVGARLVCRTVIRGPWGPKIEEAE
jgi:hypothetical protein